MTKPNLAQPMKISQLSFLNLNKFIITKQILYQYTICKLCFLYLDYIIKYVSEKSKVSKQLFENQ